MCMYVCVCCVFLGWRLMLILERLLATQFSWSCQFCSYSFIYLLIVAAGSNLHVRLSQAQYVSQYKGTSCYFLNSTSILVTLLLLLLLLLLFLLLLLLLLIADRAFSTHQHQHQHQHQNKPAQARCYSLSRRQQHR